MAPKKTFDWSQDCTYDDTRKKAFHRNARAALVSLATELGLAPGSYDLRSNKGGTAVSGEITLHHDEVYVQVSQSAVAGASTGLLVRTCQGRRDFTGGHNNLLNLSLLDEPSELAAKVRRIAPVLVVDHGHDTDVSSDMRP